MFKSISAGHWFVYWDCGSLWEHILIRLAVKAAISQAGCWTLFCGWEAPFMKLFTSIKITKDYRQSFDFHSKWVPLKKPAKQESAGRLSKDRFNFYKQKYQDQKSEIEQKAHSLEVISLILFEIICFEIFSSVALWEKTDKNSLMWGEKFVEDI